MAAKLINTWSEWKIDMMPTLTKLSTSGCLFVFQVASKYQNYYRYIQLSTVVSIKADFYLVLFLWLYCFLTHFKIFTSESDSFKAYFKCYLSHEAPPDYFQLEIIFILSELQDALSVADLTALSTFYTF